MKYSHYFVPTLKELPKDVEIKSHQLLLRAGCIRQVSSGLYTLLPLGLRVMQKIENIVREEMNKANALEISMPVTIPSELWEKSGRWEQYGKELCRFQDRLQRWYCLGPTHEEVVTQLVADEVVSYKQLPLNLYQIHTKFRDEIRPRYGLMRAREFVMKDAYSFHLTQEEVQNTFESMRSAYQHIFNRCGLEVAAVEADSGNIGGSHSVEFMVLSEVGENHLATCDTCSYLANIEVAKSKAEYSTIEATDSLTEVSTPNHSSIESLAHFLKISPAQILKSRLFYNESDQQFLMVLLPGSRQLNELKFSKHFDPLLWREAKSEDLQAVAALVWGFMGPLNLPDNCVVYFDHHVDINTSYVIGANQQDKHYTGFCPKRDFKTIQRLDLSTVLETDHCPQCESGRLSLSKATELGHIFNLGDKYAAAMNAQVSDETGRLKTLQMGCYGIGIGRTLSAIAEHYSDDKGLIWPQSVSPFDVHLLTVSIKDPDQMQCSQDLYLSLQEELQLSVLWDERKESPGRKFADADLLGIGIQIIVGKSFKSEGLVELKYRSSTAIKISIDQLKTNLKTYFQ